MKNLTDLETKMIRIMIECICHPEACSGYIDDDFRALAKTKGISSKVISGVVSSLVQKGLVKTMEGTIQNDDDKWIKCPYYTFNEGRVLVNGEEVVFSYS